MLPGIPTAVHSLASDLLITNLTTLEDVTEGLAGLFMPRLTAMLSGLLGGIGLALAAAVVMVAGYLPARAATKVNPMEALRAE